MYQLRKSIVFAGLLVSAAMVMPASAETMMGALAKAYVNNSSLNSERAGQRVTDENVAIAKSGYRPTIAGSATVKYNHVDSMVASIGITSGSVGIQLNQSLFDGFQTLNNVKASEAKVLAGQLSLLNTEETTLYNAATAYLDVIRDRQIARFREQNLGFLGEQVRAANSRFEVGEGTKTDVAQARASRSGALAQLASARAQAQSSEATYRQTIGVAPGSLSPAAVPTKLLPKSLDKATAIALSQHPAILAAEHTVDAAVYAVKGYEGALLPNLSATASLSRNYDSSSTFSPFNNSATIGATLTVPLYQGGKVSAQVRQAKETLSKARIQVDATRDQVLAAITSAWTGYIAAQEGVAADRDLVDAAQLALNGVEEERNVGQRTTLDVLNAQADVLTAQVSLVSAEHDLVVAGYAILSAMGRLTARDLGLHVTLYQPQEHYDAVKDKWFGLRTPDGR